MKKVIVLFLSFILIFICISITGCKDKPSRHPQLFDHVFIWGLNAVDLRHGLREDIFGTYNKLQENDSVMSFLQVVTVMAPDAYYHSELHYIKCSDTTEARKLFEDKISPRSLYSSNEFVKIVSDIIATGAPKIVGDSGALLDRVFIKDGDNITRIRIIKAKLAIDIMTWEEFKSNFPDIAYEDIEVKFYNFIFYI